MYESVRSSFLSFTTRFEGHVSYMYLDIKGLVTIGVGNLIDPMNLALGLPFVHKSDASAATQEEIQSDWQAVKDRTDLAHAKNYLQQFDALTTLKLTDDGINQLVQAKLDAMEAGLKHTAEFADLEDWPADAQLGLLSMAWGMGAGFGPGFPKFRAACAAKDWDTAAAESRIDDTNNPGVTPRNAANHTLFTNAAQVSVQGFDYATLYYPSDLTDGGAAPQPPTPVDTTPAISWIDPDSGQIGDVITIAGQNFIDVVAVGFGETSAIEMSVDSDTQITVSVPDGSGAVSVTVITESGSSDPSGAEFTYL
jgi:GH24 family phage-related lysozyme (muramidase)